MSRTVPIGSGVVTLPVTGSPTLAIAVAGLILLATGLLMFRSARLRRIPA
jgi:LPXTG-motif cell wall-anchored protein